MSTLWSGRFDSEPNAAVFDFGASFRFDRRLFEDDVIGSLAWAQALKAAGVLSADDAAATTAALTEILAKGQADPAWVAGPDEDVHSFVERQLVERIGDTGRRLHTGRSRNEQVSLDLRLFLRRRSTSLQASVRRLIAALVSLAQRCGDARMPAYTHLRRAQPVLIAHFLLAHAAAMRRDHHRFSAAAREADALPLGSGAVAGTNYAIDTAALAQTLGFSRVVANSIDASSDRDFVSTFLHACALTMVHLSRFAEDMVIFSGEEYGFFELSDASSTGSSMMPQKKNPDPLELVRGKSGRTIGHLAGWLATMKGLPSGYNKDLQEDKEAVFDADQTVAGSLGAMAIVVEGLTVETERAERAAAGLLLATDVADYLVGKGLPFRRAHELVGAMTRRLLAEGRDFESLPLSEWRGHSELFEADVIDRVTTRASVAARRTPQSTHPEAVQASLEEIQAWLAEASEGRSLKAEASGPCCARLLWPRQTRPYLKTSLSGGLMQQRQPRLGDVVDDYCPRERRVTNHAVVAMVGDEVKQTRCTTCDAEHDYKHAKVPPQRKKKDVPGALYQQVLDGIPRVVPTPEQAPDDEAEAAAVQAEGDVDVEGEAAPLAAEGAPAGEHEGPVHRRLIRATLPRLPGAEPPVRREPEFTMRTPAHTRPGKPKNGFRGGGMQRAGGPAGQGQGQGNAHGNRGKRHGRPGGEGAWNRSGQPGSGGGRGPGGQRPGRGDKKRSR